MLSSNNILEDQLLSLVNNMHHFVAILDIDGSLIFVNDRPLKTSGLKRKDVADKKFWDARWWNYSSDIQKIIESDCKLAATGGNVFSRNSN